MWLAGNPQNVSENIEVDITEAEMFEFPQIESASQSERVFEMRVDERNGTDGEVGTPGKAKSKQRVLPSQRVHCPNFVFKRKHHCEDCSDEAAALRFTQRRNENYRPVRVNHVLMGRTQYEEDGRGYCKNVSPKPVMLCNVRVGKCGLEGERCYTWHRASDGHLMENGLVCEDTESPSAAVAAGKGRG